MKTLYFDLIGGVSGDMVVASLLDLGGNSNYLRRELQKAVKKYNNYRPHFNLQGLTPNEYYKKLSSAA